MFFYSFLKIKSIKYPVNIFNFFSELKTKCNMPQNVVVPYNIVNIGGQIVYVEGQRGLLELSDTTISCKLKTGFVEIKGSGLFVRELTPSTILIEGKIYKTEVF